MKNIFFKNKQGLKISKRGILKLLLKETLLSGTLVSCVIFIKFPNLVFLSLLLGQST